jgi:hypothetical protein
MGSIKMSLIHQLLAKQVTIRLLRRLDEVTIMDRSELIKLAGGKEEQLKAIVESMQDLGLISEITLHVYQLTPRGKRCLILHDMLEEDSIKEGIRKLSYFMNKEFELLTENMTGRYFEILSKGRIFQNVYICSPWIHLGHKARETLRKVVEDSKKSLRQVNILIVTRPPDIRTEFGRQAEQNLRWLRELKSDISLVKNLHTKLYIAEPGPIGGRFFAIFGSENLTGSRNIELGIEIEDTSILRKLITYFFDIFNHGKPYISRTNL